MSQKPLQTHQPDAHAAHPAADAPDTPPASNAAFRPFHPLVIGIMVGCIALSITEFLHRIIPDWNGAYFLITPIVTALASHTTYRVSRVRYPSAADRSRAQIIELAVVFLLLKAVGYLDNTPAEIWGNIRHWSTDIFSLFDPETLTAFAIACAAWFSTAHTARDLEAVVEPLLYKGETGPMERLSQRFLAGGMALLFFSGLARIEIATLRQPERPASHGLALNVLVYFVLGLIVLGQVRFTRLNRLWTLQKYKVTGALNEIWLKYSLLSLLGALAIAFVLPTHYTVGLLDIARFMISAVVYLVTLIFTFIFALISLLPSFFKPTADFEAPSAVPAPELPPFFAEQTANTPIPWLAVLRSAIFWIVILGSIFYVIYSYLKEQPETLRALKAFKVTHVLRRWWHTWQTWWRGARRTLRAKLPALTLNLRRRKEARQETRALRRKGAALREQIFYGYLETLERAREEGFPRGATQTPYEYQHTLAANLPEAHAEMTALTEAFVEARYSAHPVDADDVAQLQANARRVRAALDMLRATSYQSSAISQQPSASEDQSSAKAER